MVRREIMIVDVILHQNPTAALVQHLLSMINRYLAIAEFLASLCSLLFIFLGFESKNMDVIVLHENYSTAASKEKGVEREKSRQNINSQDWHSKPWALPLLQCLMFPTIVFYYFMRKSNRA